MRLKLKTWTTVLALCLCTAMYGQMPNDGIFLAKKELCNVVTYNHSSWKKYWEGERLRENSNIGTVRTQAIMPMVGYGITDKINAFVGLPYVWTHASAGTMAGQRGWQDFSGGIKAKLYTRKFGSFETSLQGFGGFSIPVTNYVADFLPLSIGLQSKTLTGRAIVHVEHASKLHATATWAYTGRSNITIDVPAYYTEGKQYNTNQVYMYNVIDYSLRVGYNPTDFLVEAYFEQFITQGGGNIRRDLMPFPSNNMTFNRVGLHGIYRWGKTGHFQTAGGIGYTLNGINVGKALNWNLGVMYVLSVGKKNKPAN